MTVIVFLVDSSASMGQKTYVGTTYVDAARAAIEYFLKLRSKDPMSKGDRYMLLSFEEEFPKNVRAGWRDGQATFTEQLKNLQTYGVTSFGPAIGNAFRFVNLNRAQSGLENYGFGRAPYFTEPVNIVAFTDGGSLSTLSEGVLDEVRFMKPVTPGSEMTEEPFRWDQRLFTVVFRYPGHHLKERIPATTVVPPTDAHVNVMCQTTGGRSYDVRSHKLIQQVIDDILRRVQCSGVMARFEHVGPEPARIVTENDGEKVAAIPQNSDWKSNVLMICKPSRFGPSTFLGHWPIPEAYWPDSIMATLPVRRAHPVVSFRCDPCEPPVLNNDFPYDKYELEACPLTQMILERKQPNVCWQVFVENSSNVKGIGYPFGYIKPSSNMQVVNMFILPYNYPVMLSILDELRESKGRNTVQIRARMERYLTTVPHYYYPSLKKHLKRMNFTHSLLEEQGQVYSYPIVSYLTRIKQMGKDEQERHNNEINERLLQTNARLQAPHIQVPVLRTSPRPQAAPPAEPVVEEPRKPGVLPLPPPPPAPTKEKEPEKVLMINVGDSKVRTATHLDPSSYFRNPFDLDRKKLFTQIARMKMNFDQRVSDSTIPVLEGGMPGTRIKLQQAESLHNQMISTMGDYNTYVNRLKALGGGNRKLVEEKMGRFHAFGNPFKEKKVAAIDELSVDESSSSVGGGSSGMGSGSVVKSTEKSRPRRKTGPIQYRTGSVWRKRLRSMSVSGSETSSVVSDFSDIGSVSSLEDDVIIDEGDASEALVIAENDNDDYHQPLEDNDEIQVLNETTSNGNSKDDARSAPILNGTSKRKRRASPERRGRENHDDCLPPPTKRPQPKPTRLSTEDLRDRKLAISAIARSIYERPDKICQRCVESVKDVATEDQLKLLKTAVSQAKKFERQELIDCLEREVIRIRDPRNTSRVRASTGV